MLPAFLKKRLLPPELDAAFARATKPLGSLEYDRWGYHQGTGRTVAAVTRLFYERYFRVEAFGREHIPENGRIMIVSNHSGYLPLDAALIGYSMLTNPFGPRIPRALIERFFPAVPYLGNFMSAIGAVAGGWQHCRDLLLHDEAVIVFPEGIRGSGKGFSKRYQLQRFSAGFVETAIETGTPVIPVAVVGCEEALPMLGSLDGLAARMGLPYLAVAPPFPVPVKITIEFGEPMRLSGPVECEEDLEHMAEEVKQRIRKLLQTGLDRRSGAPE